MPRIGYVVSTEGENAIVSTSPRGACEGCSGGSSCHIDPFTSTNKPVDVQVKNPIKAKAGDVVEFDLPGHAEMRQSFIVWGLPLIGMVLGAIAGNNLHTTINISKDPATLLGAVLGFVLFFLPAIFYDRAVASGRKTMPEITAVVSSGKMSCKAANEN